MAPQMSPMGRQATDPASEGSISPFNSPRRRVRGEVGFFSGNLFAAFSDQSTLSPCDSALPGQHEHQHNPLVGGGTPSTLSGSASRPWFPSRRKTRRTKPILCTLAAALVALGILLSLVGGRRGGSRGGDTGASLHFAASSGDSINAAEPLSEERSRKGCGGEDKALFLSAREVARELLPDGRGRCVEPESGKGGWRCLPTTFFLGVSKCGTTSMSNWLAEHPRTQWVSPVPGHDFREAHVFDVSPKFWHETNFSAHRERLATAADLGDTVIDFTPHYSIIGETPHRIADLFGDGALRSKGLRFLVLLREPVGRTISSWMYKTNVEDDDIEKTPAPGASAPAPVRPSQGHLGSKAAQGKNVTAMPARAAAAEAAAAVEGAEEGAGDRLLEEKKKRNKDEHRGLAEAMKEGVERVARLSECFANATENGLFGREAEITYCTKTKGNEQCEGNVPCEICSTHTEPWCNPRHYLGDILYNAHVAKSCYAMQLQRWFNVFGRERFKVVFTEDMAEDPVKTLMEVMDFLGLDPLDPNGQEGLRSMDEWVEIVSARYNTAETTKKDQLEPQVTPELRQSMREYFAPHNKALQDLLGVPLPSSWHVAW